MSHDDELIELPEMDLSVITITPKEPCLAWAKNVFQGEAGVSWVDVEQEFKESGNAYLIPPYDDGEELEGILAAPGVAAEVLLDGHHIPEELFRVAFLCKGAAGLTAASDATPFTGLPAAEGQVLRYGGPGGQQARISRGRACSVDGAALVGSIMPLGDMLPCALAWCDHDAATAGRLLATTAADLLGESSLGRIAPGCAADLVLAARPSGAVRAVWMAGERQSPVHIPTP